ncbi:hypothetical protein MHK_001852 [Candidatus Magnetomorum sp. HK-1]|nr:hypothetical protein MHK_001852 [Candidatus Magnetomorum sp. HK-1]
MRIDPIHYLEASSCSIDSSRKLHFQARYSDAIYLAGVSVECLLRAFITHKFDKRHDLHELFKASSLEKLIPDRRRREVGCWLGTIWARWKNNYRYVSDERLKSEFKRLKHDRGISGDYLKENSRMVINCAYNLRILGENQWRHLNKK